MKRLKQVVAALAVALATGCGATGDGAAQQPPVFGEQTTTAPSGENGDPLMATVNLGIFSADCRAVKCWLPTQFGPRLVERQSVSLEERTADDPKGAQAGWPMDGGPEDKGPEDGDKIKVLCVIKGGQYANAQGHPVNDWYRVVVPEDKAEPAAKERAERAPGGGYLAYVGISWLYLPPGRQAPPCEAV